MKYIIIWIRWSLPLLLVLTSLLMGCMSNQKMVRAFDSLDKKIETLSVPYDEAYEAKTDALFDGDNEKHLKYDSIATVIGFELNKLKHEQDSIVFAVIEKESGFSPSDPQLYASLGLDTSRHMIADTFSYDRGDGIQATGTSFEPSAFETFMSSLKWNSFLKRQTKTPYVQALLRYGVELEIDFLDEEIPTGSTYRLVPRRRRRNN